MSATGQARGHVIAWDGSHWRYPDGVIADTERPCGACGVPAGADDPDPCLGWIEGVTAACCGHGVAEGYVVRGGRREPLVTACAGGSGDPMCDVCGGRGYVGTFSATHGAPCPCNGIEATT